MNGPDVFPAPEGARGGQRTSAAGSTRRLRARRAIRVGLLGVTLPLTAVLGFGISQPSFPTGPSSTPAPGEWTGVVHVHTEVSDGSGTVDEVARVAREEGLDFVVVTDHNRFAEPTSGYRDGPLVLIGEEATTDRGEHILVIGGQHPRLREGGRLAVPAQPDDALRIVAHPFGPSRRWKSDYPPSIDAIEIWNADTERHGDPLGDWIPALLLLPTRPSAALYRLLDRPAASLELWDSAEVRRLSAVCSVDAHQRMPIGDLDVPFPTYRQSFSLARMHLLLDTTPTGDAEHDGRLVIEALRAGRGYCGFDGMTDARGLEMKVVSGEREAGPGQRVPWSRGARMEVRLPPGGSDARSVLFRDGERVAEARGASWKVPLDRPGSYRLEVSLDVPRDGRGWLPWILTNRVSVTTAPPAPRPAPF